MTKQSAESLVAMWITLKPGRTVERFCEMTGAPLPYAKHYSNPVFEPQSDEYLAFLEAVAGYIARQMEEN